MTVASADPIAEHLDALRSARYSRATIDARRHILSTLPHPVLDATLAEQADAATTRDALAAAARLMGLCGDLSDFQPDLTPEPTPSVTEPQEADQ